MKQTIYEQSLTAKYDIGKRIYEGDRVFRYCRALDALASPKRGASNDDCLHEYNTELIAYQGDVTITILNTVCTADQFKDGYLNIWSAPTHVCLRIKGNTVSDGTRAVFTLKDPLIADVPAGTATDAHANLYNNCGEMAGLAIGARQQVVAIPLIAVTAEYYFWGQVWGPICGIAHTGGGLGVGNNEQDVYFWNDGSIASAADIIADSGEAGSGTGHQRAGFMLAKLENPAGAAADDIFFMLQLSP